MPELRWAFIHPFQLRLQRGIEVYLWNLAVALVHQGIQVDILTWQGPLEIPAYARVPGIRLRRVPAVRYFQAYIAVFYYLFWLLCGRYHHLFVHFACYGEGPALCLARLFRRLPFSVVFHFPPSLVPHQYRAFTCWGFQRAARHLVAVSRATADEVQAWSGRTCAVIGHGVDPERFRPDEDMRIAVRQELHIGSSDPVMVSVSALEERKGIQWVIRALPLVRQRFPHVRYLVVGAGPFLAALEQLATDLSVTSSVYLLGSRLDVRPFLCAADIMMVLARGEASSISLLEALACALPAITARRPPFDELVQPQFGIMVDEQNTSQVASAIGCLLANQAVARAMGLAGRTYTMQYHSWEAVAALYVDLVGTE